MVTIADIFPALIERRSCTQQIPAEAACAMLCARSVKLGAALLAAFRPVARAAAGPA